MHVQFFTFDDPPLPLRDDAVHVWSVSLDRDGDETFLNVDELRRAERFKMERYRKQFVAARASLRQILGSYLEIDPRAVRIQTEPGGKPVLDPSHAGGVQFNLSHSRALAVYSVTRLGRTGIDVEYQKEIADMDSLVGRFFGKHDADLYQTLAASEKLPAFFRAWTRKEAVLKAIGRGVQSLDQCEVTFLPGEPEAVLRMGDDHDVKEKWLLRSWQPESQFVAAVAVNIG
ncbi:MAG: 4'-phosphopantetheinyl transferase superfamily protein [Planctomycetes bacterium]|nr:4'-phosphopantetheinyl transferase superfamily protein [Planctomycetota bacterium]